jgi:hypothetical protein
VEGDALPGDTAAVTVVAMITADMIDVRAISVVWRIASPAL